MNTVIRCQTIPGDPFPGDPSPIPDPRPPQPQPQPDPPPEEVPYKLSRV